MGVLYPQSLRAIHLNLIVATPPPISAPFSFVRFLVNHFLNLYMPGEAEGLKKAQAHKGNGDGYFEIQKQRPVTIGIALEDSPVALLTWIYEKLVGWTDEYPWTDDEVCEWISLYWFSRAGPGASVVIYHEAFKGDIEATASIFPQSAKMVSPPWIIPTPSRSILTPRVIFRDSHISPRRFSARQDYGTTSSAM